jgi:hypothetical protein
MRILQYVVLRVVCLAFLAACVAVMWFGSSEALQLADERFPDGAGYRFVPGALGIIIAFIGIFPWRKRKRELKTISFAGVHGNVVIQLDSVENTINRAVGKLPEVKKVSVTVVPTEDARKVRVTADVTLHKAAGVGARETGDIVSAFISETTRRILGSDEVMAIDLNVRGILVDTKLPSVATAAAPVEETVPVAEPEALVEEPAEEPETETQNEAIPLLDPSELVDEEEEEDESLSPLPEIDLDDTDEDDEPESDDAIGLELADDVENETEDDADEKPSSDASLW